MRATQSGGLASQFVGSGFGDRRGLLNSLRQRPFELIDALPGDGGDGVELELAALSVGGQLFELVRIGCVHFGGDDDHRLLEQSVAEAGELIVDHLEVFDGIGTARGVRDVHEVSEYAGALNVAEKLSAETRAFMCAFDQAGYVRDDERLLMRLFTDCDYTQVGLEGGEGVVCNFGFGRGDARDERGFSRVGVADQSHIGEELELEAVYALFTGTAHLVFAGSLMSAGSEVLIAAAATAAFGYDDALVGLGEVMDEFTGLDVVKRRPDRDLQYYGFAVQACAIGAHAVLAALPLMLGVIAEVDKGVVALGRFHDHVTAPASVAARGAAARDEFLAAKGHAAVATVAGLDPDFGFINKHKLLLLSDLRHLRAHIR